MSELKIYLPKELEERFRKKAMEAYGYGRGSISKAATDAISMWCTTHDTKKATEGTNGVETKVATEKPEIPSSPTAPITDDAGRVASGT